MMKLIRFILPAILVLSVVMQSAAGQNTYCGSGGIVNSTAPWYCNQINQALLKYWQIWEPVALLAVFVSFSIASIIFGAGIFLRNDRIRNFGIGEYYEAIASALIVIGFSFIAAVMFGLIPGAAAGPVNPYVTSLTYMSNTITTLQAESGQLWSIAAKDGFFISITFDFCPPGSGPNPFTCAEIPQLFSYAIYWLYYIPSFTLLDLQFDILGILYSEFWIILFFMYVAIPVFLVPGVILRSLIPTRGLGGMMIAAAIGFYMVMPLLFSVAFYFTNTATQQCTSQGTVDLQNYGNGVGAQTNAITPSSPLVQTLNSIQVCMDSYWLSVLFYPALIMALTYAIILQIAEFIGGMAQLSGRIRV